MGIWKKHTNIYDDLAEVELYIRNSLKTRQKILAEAVEGLLNAGGKRLRPALVLLAGMFGQYDKEKLIPLAASIEILHMATLVHDDVIDEADVRRGRPTVQSRFGNDIAVFTGDYLFTRSFSIVTQKTTFENMHRLSQAIKAICEGEIEQYESRYNKNVSVRRYLKRIYRKTALLFALSCQVGALESQCQPKVVNHITHFGREFGMAFQITDDLLDFSGLKAEVGKPIFNDFAQGIYTLPIIYALQHNEYKRKMAALLESSELGPEHLEEVKGLVKQSGGLDYARKMAARYIERCRRHLGALPKIYAREVMEELLEELIERRY